MAKKRYDIVVGQKDKNDKTHWKNIGVVLQNEKGFSMKIELIPTGWDGWAQLFEPKAKEEKTEKPGKFDDMENDIPY